MAGKEILQGKKILAVDDEEDVLSVITEELDSANVSTAADFETARKLLEGESFDLVILDIMGVRGFDLLDFTREKRIPAVMLTAHAMTPDSLQMAINKGAVSFLPKDELVRLSDLIQEILEGVEAGRTHWDKLTQRLGSRFKQLWGSMWDEIEFPKGPRITW